MANMGVSEWITDPKEFEKVLKEIKEEIHVHPPDDRQINKNNLILKDGAERIGIPQTGHGPNPRNCFDCRECGFSHLGCHYDSKQSTLVTFIPQALATGNSVVFCDCSAERITCKGHVATGADAELAVKGGEEKHRLRVDANVVIVCAGAINSSALLLNSNVPNRHGQVGKGLSIHPSPLVIAEFPNEVLAYRGIPMSYHVREYSVLNGVPGILEDDPPVMSDMPGDQRGGFMLESVFPNPGQFGAFLPGLGESHKEMMMKLNYYGAAGILIRDTPKGSVSVNPSGEPVIHYGLGPHDRKNLSNGIRKLVEIFFAEGALRVIVTHRTSTIITQEEYARDPDLLKKLILPDNCGQEHLYMGAVHPQGGNRMGQDPRESVVDSHCRHHNVKNLFVCDASVFPTAAGVNPMLTIMGIAKRTAHYINGNWAEITARKKFSVDTRQPWFRDM
jgi:choline dehydrogenase-like flavoprotein